MRNTDLLNTDNRSFFHAWFPCRMIFLPFFFFISFQSFSRDGFRVMFYNVDNFFDCNHDSLKNDLEFLPSGIRGWTPVRFWKKAGQISKVISAVGENKFPEIVGLAEVENEQCVRSLVFYSPLKNAHYSYIHYESPDARGVDVCLLYNRYLFKVVKHTAMAVLFKDEPTRKTRDVLYVCGKTFSGDTLHLFVCHFPSRLGGELETERYRRAVSVLIRKKVDSLYVVNKESNILIMGDFNDFPTNRSLSVDLRADSPIFPPVETGLYNLMLPLSKNPDVGTTKFQADWGVLDQIIVSGTLLKRTFSGGHIFTPDFLFVQDDRWLGRKPFRTFNGMTYQGGFSDHLPVYVDFSF